MAEKYDKFLFVFLNRLRKKTVATAKKLNAKKIADLCCGTGNQLKYFKKQGFTDIIGVDLSENMTKIAKIGKEKIDCKIEDATNTSLESDSYDFVNITLALHEKDLKTQKGIIAEAKRILKNGGYLAICDYYFGKGSFLLGKIGSKLVEKMVGGEHYANFKEYIKRGGMDFLFPEQKPIQITHFILRSAQLRIYKIEK